MLFLLATGALVPQVHRASPAQMMAGFGAPPPAPKTLEEVVRGFGNRLPKDFEDPCMCGSSESYASCCRPYHKGDKKPETPEWALKSRYAAFAYRLPIYIIETTDKSNGDYMKDKIKWAKKLSKTSMFDTFECACAEGSVLAETVMTRHISIRATQLLSIQARHGRGGAWRRRRHRPHGELLLVAAQGQRHRAGDDV